MSSISAVSGSAASQYAYGTTTNPSAAQIQSDLQSLSSALQSGNLSNAQGAFATLKKDAPGLIPTSGTASSNPVSNALGAVGTALSQGNITGAQQAFATLAQTAKVRHHSHHHNGGGVSNSTGPSASIGNGSATASLLNVTA